jgi:hypothetical protein
MRTTALFDNSFALLVKLGHLLVYLFKVRFINHIAGGGSHLHGNGPLGRTSPQSCAKLLHQMMIKQEISGSARGHFERLASTRGAPLEPCACDWELSCGALKAR